jgi:hypothetical protein
VSPLVTKRARPPLVRSHFLYYWIYRRSTWRLSLSHAALQWLFFGFKEQEVQISVFSFMADTQECVSGTSWPSEESMCTIVDSST